MKTPILESGNLSEEKKRARISEGIPAVNILNDRSVMIMYASRPVALSDVNPRKPAICEKAVGAIVAMSVPRLEFVVRGLKRCLTTKPRCSINFSQRSDKERLKKNRKRSHPMRDW
jgi:hypothetical protein